MLANISRDEIKGYECKHVNYVVDDEEQNDLLVVKEQVHLKDGRIIPNVRFIENYKRDFYVTKPGFRNHDQKKEWEKISRLQRFTSTQVGLARAVARALGNPAARPDLRVLARSPYLYGTDITTPVLVKRKYMDRYPDCRSLNTVAAFDIESDVIEGHELPISAALTFKDKAVLAVTKDFLGSIIDPEVKIQKAFQKYLGKYIAERNITLEVVIVDQISEGIKSVFQRAHEWMPDIISIWNMNYDLPKILDVLEKQGMPPEDVFCHPKLPPQYRKVRYIEGPASKLTASGKYMPLHPADRWHTMDCPAAFYFLDSMCVYKKVRVAKGNEPSYALDYILNKDLKLGKLNFEEADGYTGLRWHQHMQKNHKIEYLIYNLFDCIALELLDEKNKDLASTVSVLCEHSEYSRFPSQPRRTCDDLHFFCLENGLVIGSTSDQMVDELDRYVISPEGWVTTLASHQVVDNGLKIIEELPDVRTNLRAHVLD